MAPPLSPTSKSPYFLRAMHEWMVDNGYTPYVRVNNRAPDVCGPPSEMANPISVYNISYDATADLELTHEVRFLARFAGKSCLVHFPVSAIESIYTRETGEGMAFTPEFHAGREVTGDPQADATLPAADPEPAKFTEVPEGKRARPDFMKVVK